MTLEMPDSKRDQAIRCKEKTDAASITVRIRF